MLGPGDDRRDDERGLARERKADAFEADDAGDDKKAVGMDEVGNGWHEGDTRHAHLHVFRSEKKLRAGEANRRPLGIVAQICRSVQSATCRERRGGRKYLPCTLPSTLPCTTICANSSAWSTSSACCAASTAPTRASRSAVSPRSRLACPTARRCCSTPSRAIRAASASSPMPPPACNR